MFSALNPDELNIVLGAMQRVVKEPGDLVIKQGDDGDNLYVVETGTLSCFKTGKVSFNLLSKHYVGWRRNTLERISAR